MRAEAHRARHEAGLKEMARWPERAGGAHVAGHRRDGLAPARRRTLARPARRLSGMAERARLAPALAGAGMACIPLRGPRGHGAANKAPGRRRVALADAGGTELRMGTC